MMADLNGARVLEATIVVPLLGIPIARVMLEGEVTPAASGLVLTLAGYTLRCALARDAVPYQGKSSVLLVGGTHGWPRTVGARGYSISGGVRASTVLADLAREVGETIMVGEDRELGAHYSREAASASVHLNTITAGLWRVDSDGVTRTGARTDTSLVASPFAVLSLDGVRRSVEIATETPADFVPGRSFLVSSQARAIVGVTHKLSKGALRTEVML